MGRWRWHAGAALLYAAGAWIMLDHGASLTRTVLGEGPDPGLIMWCLAWWPWAFAHHAPSLHTMLLWRPAGLNLAWTTSVPLLALLALPATLLSGPVLAFNLLALAAPWLSALAAYALCLELFAAPDAAIFGGWLYGFSTYQAAQSFDHVNLDFVPLLPLMLLALARRLGGRLGRRGFVLALGALAAGEFCVSFEICATFALFAGLGWGLAWAMLPERREALGQLARDVPLAGLLAALLVSPLLAGMLTGPDDVAHPANWPSIFSIDPLNFFIPTRASAYGGQAAAGLAARFSGGLDEQDGYLGLPLILVLSLAWFQFRARPDMRVAFLLLGAVLVASLGPRLQIAGVQTGLALPWALIEHLPLLGAALPARLMLHAFLLAAIVLAGWVAAGRGRGRLAAAGLACLALMPAPHPAAPSPALAFFKPGRVQAALGPAPELLILPFAIRGDSSFWQAEARFGFTQAGGYLGYPPRGMQDDPAVHAMFFEEFPPNFAADLAAFCRRTGVDYVVATPGTVAPELAALRALDAPSQKIDDVIVFTVPHQ